MIKKIWIDIEYFDYWVYEILCFLNSLKDYVFNITIFILSINIIISIIISKIIFIKDLIINHYILKELRDKLKRFWERKVSIFEFWIVNWWINDWIIFFVIEKVILKNMNHNCISLKLIKSITWWFTNLLTYQLFFINFFFAISVVISFHDFFLLYIHHSLNFDEF